jgi:hypothetical protein
MKLDSRFWKILFWETLENWPLIVGLLVAIRLKADSGWLAFACLVASTALGALSIHFTEIKKFSNQPTFKETVVNFIVFTVLAIAFLFYYSLGETWWSNWLTDLGLGALVGVVLTVGESLGWSNTTTVKTHAIAMAIASAFGLLVVRFIYQLQPLTLMLGVATLATVAISVSIVWIDYWPIKSISQSTAQPIPKK